MTMAPKIEVKSKYYLFCPVCGNKMYTDTIPKENECPECSSTMNVKIKQYCISCKYQWYSASRRIYVCCPNCRHQCKNSMLVSK